jgi:hypothetical protein
VAATGGGAFPDPLFPTISRQCLIPKSQGVILMLTASYLWQQRGVASARFRTLGATSQPLRQRMESP